MRILTTAELIGGLAVTVELSYPSLSVTSLRPGQHHNVGRSRNLRRTLFQTTWTTKPEGQRRFLDSLYAGEAPEAVVDP
jgi:hypothetical protein